MIIIGKNIILASFDNVIIHKIFEQHNYRISLANGNNI